MIKGPRWRPPIPSAFFGTGLHGLSGWQDMVREELSGWKVKYSAVLKLIDGIIVFPTLPNLQ
jgi:hypothetical protein